MAYINTLGDLPPLPRKSAGQTSHNVHIPYSAHAQYMTTPMKPRDTTQTSYSPIRDQFISNANPNRPRVIHDDDDGDSINNSKNNIELKEFPTVYGESTNELPLLQQHESSRKLGRPKRQKKPQTLKNKLINFPYFTVILTIIDICVFIVELVKMKELTGSAFQTKPYLNPMLGPSSYIQIYIGSRFEPCIHNIPGITDRDIDWPCPNSTTTATQVCSLDELCQFGDGVTDPNQTWRILSAMFLHAGFVHIIFNLLLQCTMGLEVEKNIGSLRYIVIYMVSGISGNIFGINFAQDGISSSGASGALFGIIAVNLLIFLLHRDQSTVRHYGILITVLLFEVISCFVLGLLPGLDNFCHIGGFVSGLLLGLAILNDPKFIRIRRNVRKGTYKVQGFGTNFSSHMDNIKKKRFIIWIIVRIVAIALLIAWFVALILNFQKNGGGNCSWCKYFNCLPVHDWCSRGDLSKSLGDSSASSASSTSPANSMLSTGDIHQ